MLVLKTAEMNDWYDETTQEFVSLPAQTLLLEHSLLAISKWESKWRKPFLDPRTPKTTEESLDYVRCMTLNTVDPRAVYALRYDQIQQVNAYIENPATATTINNRNRPRGSREIVTSELVYYWMIDLGIPFECEKWNLNRLMTLIQICGIKGSPEKKMGRKDILKQNAALNAARRKRHGTRG